MSIYIGCHLSVTNGYEAMGRTMLALGGSTFAFFTRNPRGGKSRELLPEDAAGLLSLPRREQAGPLVAHGSYTMNLSAANPSTRENGLDMLEKDLKRMELLPGNLYNFHPGAHVGQGTETGVRLIAEALNRFLTPEMQTTVLLETMAGKGTEIGRTFEELARIIDLVEPGLRDRMGVCLDTCHVHDGGYPVSDDPAATLAEFDRVVGLDRLKAIHLNDSKNPVGAHKDRHEKLGDGHIRKEAFEYLVNCDELEGVPFYLETPNDEAGYERGIAYLRSLRKKD